MSDRWIWLPKSLYPDNQNTRFNALSGGPEDTFAVAAFRKEYRFDKKAASVRLRFSGDTLFRLWCGDEFIASGPPAVGGDFIAPSLLKRFNEKAEKAGSKGRLYEGYGLTETVTVLSVNTLSAHKEGTVGRCIAGVKAVVLDEENNVLPPNQEGELAIAGDTLMNGYLGGNNPFIEINGERYVKSGDIGKIDEEGYLTFVSRKKRMIKKKGFNIYPLRIEKRICSIPGVDECAYFARREKEHEATYLYLVVHEQGEKDAILSKSQQILKNEFFDYEYPEHLEIRPDLPKTNVGKIDYKVLENEK